MIKEFKYIFPYWGPFLMKFKITKEDCNWILKEGKKLRTLLFSLRPLKVELYKIRKVGPPTN